MKEKLIKLLWAIWVVVIVIFIIQSFKEEISIKHEHEIFGIFIAVFSISLAMILDNEKIKINIHYKNIIQISFVIQVLLFVLLTTNPFNYYKIYYIFNIIILTFSLVLNTIIIITIFENKTISNEFKTLRKKIDALSKKEDSSVQDFENIFTSYFTWIDSNIEKNNKIYMNQIIEYYFKLLKKFYVVVYKSILQNDSSGA